MKVPAEAKVGVPSAFQFAALSLCLAMVSCDSRPLSSKQLSEAIRTGDTNYIQAYLTSGGDVNRMIQYSPSRRELVPLLDVALLYGKVHVVELLLQRGADPNRRDSLGNSPLGWAIGRSKTDVPSSVRVDMFKRLLRAGADSDASVSLEEGYTPLLDAAFLGQEEIVRILLQLGAPVDSTNSSGQTALHLAGSPGIARLLLGAGADRDRRTVTGETPAESVAKLGRYSVLAVLTNASPPPQQPGDRSTRPP